jgi:DNA topoisomerase-3
VYELDAVYACENGVTRKRTCDFRSGKVILQRPIEREQVVKLLSEGRTDLLHRFISKKGRPFSAYLVKNAQGKVGFEFAPRGKREPEAEKLKAAALRREPKRRAVRS